tara:strand:+ start:911 stop:1084 length:174 start_codon:yes stop_codon:yes gene_type:complete
VIRDGVPLTDCHSLGIAKWHIQSFFDLTEAERSALLTLLDSAKVKIDAGFSPDVYTI